MKKWWGFIQRIGYIGMSILLIFSALALISSQNAVINSQKLRSLPPQNTVILELFTSQGCSSCPPADALLAEYAAAHDEHIIALSFHVDYWNRLGWTDPFSSHAYSGRQQWYSQHLPGHSVYTPQLVVNGKSEAVGNNRNAVKNLVQKELSVKPVATIAIAQVMISEKTVSFRYQTANTGPDELLNMALVQKQATTHIKAGENEGITITNHNIVRSFNTQSITSNGTGQVSLPTAFRPSEYALVVFVQDKKSFSINAAAIKDL